MLFRRTPPGTTALASPVVHRLWAAVLIGLCLWVGAGAVLSAFGITPLPYLLAVLKMRHPWVFPAHMLTGGLGLLATLAAIMLRNRPLWHRPLGRLALVLLSLASLTALPVAAASLASPAVRVGLAAQGVASLACLGIGFAAIRAGNRELHRRAMLAAAAINFGAVVLRLLLIAFDAMGIDPEAAYAVSAWLAWLFPLAVLTWTKVANRLLP